MRGLNSGSTAHEAPGKADPGQGASSGAAPATQERLMETHPVGTENTQRMIHDGLVTRGKTHQCRRS